MGVRESVEAGPREEVQGTWAPESDRTRPETRLCPSVPLDELYNASKPPFQHL